MRAFASFARSFVWGHLSFAVFGGRSARTEVFRSVREASGLFGPCRVGRVCRFLAFVLVVFTCCRQHARHARDEAYGEEMFLFHCFSIISVLANISKCFCLYLLIRRMDVVCRPKGVFPLRGGNEKGRTCACAAFPRVCVYGIVYLITFNFLPILMKAAMARSNCSRVWAADNWIRMRAWPFGTTG